MKRAFGPHCLVNFAKAPRTVRASRWWTGQMERDVDRTSSPTWRFRSWAALLKLADEIKGRSTSMTMLLACRLARLDGSGSTEPGSVPTPRAHL